MEQEEDPMMYSLRASDAMVQFLPSLTGKTVEVEVLNANTEGLLVWTKGKRLCVDKARALYVSLLKKGYRKA
jgi:hypothetical protein